MSKRLQVLLDEEELSAIQEIARRQRMTVAEWVRQALRAARRSQPAAEAVAKLEAIHRATELSFPAPEIDEMLAEIDSGYQDGTGR